MSESKPELVALARLQHDSVASRGRMWRAVEAVNGRARVSASVRAPGRRRTDQTLGGLARRPAVADGSKCSLAINPAMESRTE